MKAIILEHASITREKPRPLEKTQRRDHLGTKEANKRSGSLPEIKEKEVQVLLEECLRRNGFLSKRSLIKIKRNHLLLEVSLSYGNIKTKLEK